VWLLFGRAIIERVSSSSVSAAAIIAAAGLALLAAACGASKGGQVARLGSTTTQNTSNPSAASAPENGALAFSRCMRSNGVGHYPDPNSSGQLVKETPEQLGVSSSRFQSGQSACRHLLPNGGSGPDAARVQQVKAQALRFSRCVRSHGVPNFPDPGSDGRIPDPATDGIDQGSPAFQAANQACRKYRPPYMPSNAAYNAYAGTHGG
jgi:hypothetical protein